MISFFEIYFDQLKVKKNKKQSNVLRFAAGSSVGFYLVVLCAFFQSKPKIERHFDI